MLKKTNFVLLFMLATICLFAQTANKPVLVVTPMDVYDAEPKAGDLLTRKIQSEFSQTAKFTVVDRNSFDKIFAQHKFQNSEWSNPDKVATMKNAFNAEYIVTSTVQCYDETFYLTINLVDVNTTAIIASEQTDAFNINDMMSVKLKYIVSDITDQIQNFQMYKTEIDRPVAVISPIDIYDIDQQSCDLLYRNLQTEYSKTKQFVIVDRNNFDKILAQHKFQDSEWSNSDKIAVMKSAFNAQYIVTTKLDFYEGKVYLTSSVIDVNSTAIVASADSEVGSVYDLIEGKLKMLVTKIMKQVNPSYKPTYKIGEFGQGGGYVFYIDGNKVYEFYGPIGFKNDEYGYVFQVTFSWSKAIEKCKKYSGGGYNDWRLPSIDELKIISKHIAQSKSSLLPWGYWSSKEDTCVWLDLCRVDYRPGEPFSVGVVRSFRTDD